MAPGSTTIAMPGNSSRLAKMTLPRTAWAHTQAGRLSDTPATTTVVFTVHNRRDMVLEAIALALRQSVPVHVIVADDASSDGTQGAVLAAYPDVTYFRSEVSRGPCYQRNQGIEAAATEIVFPLDDDSMLVDPATLQTALADFAPPDVGIVCMPFCNVLQNATIHHAPDARLPDLRFDFAACAHGLRREAALSVGGYNVDLFYTMEEGDLALRMYDSGGWRTILGTSPPLHHMQSATKTSDIQDWTGARNKTLFYYRYAPTRYVPGRIGGAIVKDFFHALGRRRMKAWARGVRDGLLMVARGKAKRTPVKLESFRAYLAQR